MTDGTTIIASAQLLWQVLARVPWLGRFLLRRAFPISKCKSLLAVAAPGDHARFELLQRRPSPALIGLEVTLHNHLPFAVDFEIWQLSVSIDSTVMLDAVLNSRCTVGAAGTACIQLPEVGLSDQQANWVRRRRGEAARIQVQLHWRCGSLFHDWQDHGAYQALVYLNKDDLRNSG